MRPAISYIFRRRYGSAFYNAYRSSGSHARSLTLSRSTSSTAAASTIGTPANGETTTPSSNDAVEPDLWDNDIDEILAPPTFSVRSLLPSPDTPPDPVITPAKLRHLLHLSALPPPETEEEESRMLKDLNDQLHFIRAIQSVDTTGVKPCVGITRDQALLTERGREGLTLEDIQKAEEEEEKMDDMGTVEWDAVALAKRKVGRYFVVPGEEGEEGEEA